MRGFVIESKGGAVPISESERKARIIQSARAARRVYRTADTAGEKMERWLDRQIERKTVITANQAMAVIPLWEDYRSKVIACELALSDFLNISSS